MAAPTLVTPIPGGAASPGAITPTVPTGTLAGDFLLLISETFDETITWSGGTETWTQHPDSPVSVAGSTRLTVYYATASAAAGSITAPTSNDPGDHALARMVAFRGVDTSDPFDDSNTGTEAADTSASFPVITTTEDECLVLNMIACDGPDGNGNATFSGESNADLTSLAERIDQSNNAGNGGAYGLWTGIKAAAGSVGATAVTLATSQTKAMLTTSLKPPAVVAPTTKNLAALGVG